MRVVLGPSPSPRQVRPAPLARRWGSEPGRRCRLAGSAKKGAGCPPRVFSGVPALKCSRADCAAAVELGKPSGRPKSAPHAGYVFRGGKRTGGKVRYGPVRRCHKPRAGQRKPANRATESRRATAGPHPNLSRRERRSCPAVSAACRSPTLIKNSPAQGRQRRTNFLCTPRRRRARMLRQVQLPQSHELLTA